MFCFFPVLMHVLVKFARKTVQTRRKRPTARLGGAETGLCSLHMLPFLNTIIHVCGANALAEERCLLKNCHLLMIAQLKAGQEWSTERTLRGRMLKAAPSVRLWA